METSWNSLGTLIIAFTKCLLTYAHIEPRDSFNKTLGNHLWSSHNFIELSILFWKSYCFPGLYSASAYYTFVVTSILLHDNFIIRIGIGKVAIVE